tara:strand:- start:319 stop:537 length:219 start_codon:yes stop_codon:yes gene_type:complete
MRITKQHTKKPANIQYNPKKSLFYVKPAPTYFTSDIQKSNTPTKSLLSALFIDKFDNIKVMFNKKYFSKLQL